MKNAKPHESRINWVNTDVGAIASLEITRETQLESSMKIQGARNKGKVCVMAFTGTKGGVGTTTLGINTAMTFVQIGKKVIYVEITPHMCSAAWFLGLHLNVPLEVQITNPLETYETFINKSILTHPTGLKILWLPPRFHDRKDNLPLDIAKVFIDQLAIHADIIILDFPMEHTEQTAAFLHESHVINAVMDVSPIGIAATKIHLSFVRNQTQNPIFLAGTNLTNILCAEKLENLQKEMGGITFTMIPPAPDFFHEAQKHQLPLVVSKPQSAPALQIFKIRDLILNLLNWDLKPSTSTGRNKNRRKEDEMHSTDIW